MSRSPGRAPPGRARSRRAPPPHPPQEELPAPDPQKLADAPGDTNEARELAAALIWRWFNDPVQFAWDAFGTQLWRKQRLILRAAARAAARGKTFRIAVRSGHKCGKSRVLAVLALWWATTRKAARVVMTAPSARQIRSTLWREIRLLFNVAKERLAALGGIGGRLYEVPDAGLQFDDQSEVVGFSTNQPERMAGTSGDNLLYLIDEASGVDLKIWEAIEGNRAGDASMVMFSNPTQTSGYFFDAFHANASLWTRFHISSEDTPNVRAGRKVVKGLATLAWIQEKRIEWGPDYKNDPRYQVRVEGEFPRSASNQVVSLAIVEQAKARWYAFAAEVLGKRELAQDPERWGLIVQKRSELAKVRARYCYEINEPLIVGLDPAWYGDDLSVAFFRRGNRMFAPIVKQGLDGEGVANAVLEGIRHYRAGSERPRVLVDVIGIGVAAYSALSKMQRELFAIPIYSSKPSRKPDDYRNLRAEILFSARDWLKSAGAMFEPNGILEAELTAPLYHLDGVGRVEVEPKKAIKKRLGRSPDHGDAFSLTCLDGVSFPVTRVLQTPPLSAGLRWGNSPGKGFG